MGAYTPFRFVGIVGRRRFFPWLLSSVIAAFLVSPALANIAAIVVDNSTVSEALSVSSGSVPDITGATASIRYFGDRTAPFVKKGGQFEAEFSAAVGGGDGELGYRYLRPGL